MWKDVPNLEQIVSALVAFLILYLGYSYGSYLWRNTRFSTETSRGWFKMSSKKQRALEVRAIMEEDVYPLVMSQMADAIELKLYSGELTRDEANVEYLKLAKAFKFYNFSPRRVGWTPEQEQLKQWIMERLGTHLPKKEETQPTQKETLLAQLNLKAT